MKGVDLGLDGADLLVWLYGQRRLGWRDFPEVDADGYIPVSRLRESVVYDAGRVSRTIRGLLDDGFIETQDSGGAAQGRRKYVQAVRINQKGIAFIRPVFERFVNLANNLLAGISQRDLEAHYRVNERISQVIKKHKRDVWKALVQ